MHLSIWVSYSFISSHETQSNLGDSHNFCLMNVQFTGISSYHTCFIIRAFCACNYDQHKSFVLYNMWSMYFTYFEIISLWKCCGFLIKLKSSALKDDFCQIKKKMALCFWRKRCLNVVKVFQLFRSPEWLRWPIAMGWRPSSSVVRRASCVNIFFSRTTGPILTKFGI